MTKSVKKQKWRSGVILNARARCDRTIEERERERKNDMGERVREKRGHRGI